MEKQDYLAQIEIAAEAMLSAGKENLADNMSARVVHCPEWDLAELIDHQATVFRFAGANVVAATDEPTSPDESGKPEGDKGEALLEWFEDSAKFILDALKAADMTQKAWNWIGDSNEAHFWFRRMVQETDIHAWDAKVAVKQSFEIPKVWAVDGVDEYLTNLLPWRIANIEEVKAPPGSIHFHCTDEGLAEGAGEWFCVSEGEQTKVTREHKKGDVAIQGTAQDLMLLVWQRIPLDSPTLTIHGDKEAAEKWISLAP